MENTVFGERLIEIFPLVICQPPLARAIGVHHKELGVKRALEEKVRSIWRPYRICTISRRRGQSPQTGPDRQDGPVGQPRKESLPVLEGKHGGAPFFGLLHSRSFACPRVKVRNRAYTTDESGSAVLLQLQSMALAPSN